MSALQSAQELQEKLQARQDELAARQKEAQTERLRRSASGAGFAAPVAREWPLRVLLAVSVGVNVLLWQRQPAPRGAHR